ncbi:peroxisomal N(1)-acetyl-spermine/spermidine oxidase [Agrilus planipennis]|uniref:Peroxisomal N(1)-acetyl-spermine/spermidine oxidase n=2 Tax=Agrilus planipennis TaxID=224129 RepID=A0A7F5RB13_AGRPL|nr:peroxisomal N(1)-acetyl-spermine/spermidine oxidase [Agrilus planipennis]
MEDSRSPGVIIVGAGAAGIATATRLLRNDFSNFIILEAQDRIGGRVFSKKFGNGMVDLGAQWCHGEERNIVYDLIKDYDVLKHDSSQFLPFQLQYSQTHFKGINESVNAELTELFFQIYEQAQDTVEITSMGDYFSKYYVEAVETKYHDNQSLKQFALNAEVFFLHMIASLEGTLSVYDVSTGCSYEECKGDQMLTWNGKGFQTILDVLMNKFPNPDNPLPIGDKILFEKEVENIQWRNDNKDGSVVVKCADGSVYGGQYVVVTPSVGVLKAKVDEMFTPPLPIDKRRAVEDIGFGAIMKVFLLYEERWWSDNFKGCGFVWSEEDREVLRNKGDIWIMDIFYLFILESNPNVLCFFVSHDNVPSIEQKTDEEVLSGINFLIEKFLGDKYTPTTPSEILRSKWRSNPYFRGTYSYQSLKSHTSRTLINETLAAPICDNNSKPVVLFAGEATHSVYYGTVHGAIETGFREADRLLSLIK